MSFFEKLNDLVDRSGYSKNSIIQKTKIDRSTFFKILRSDRVPTEQQFGAFLYLLLDVRKENPSCGITQEDLNDLLLEFAHVRLDQNDLMDWNAVRNFVIDSNKIMSTAKESAPPREENDTAKAAAAFVSRQLSLPSPVLDFYVAPSMIGPFHFSEIIAEKLDAKPRIRQIVGIYTDQNENAASLILSNLAMFIRILNQNPDCLHMYSLEDSGLGKASQLFPYYIIGKDAMLLIGSDGKTSTEVTDSALLDTYRTAFDNAVSSLNPLFTSLSDYMDLAMMLLKKNTGLGDNPLLAVESRPCFWQSTDDRILTAQCQKLGIPEDVFKFSLAYAGALNALPAYSSFMTRQGLEDFRNDHSVFEAGLNLNLDEQEMEQILENIRRKEGHSMLLVPFDDCVISRWELSIYPDEVYLFFFPNTDYVIDIKDPTVVHALHVFYDMLQKILTIQE